MNKPEQALVLEERGHQTRALILAPYGPEENGVITAIRAGLEAMGIEASAWAEMRFGVGERPISIVADAIESSDLIIADLSRQNANVMYELGYAHALRKKTILLMNEREAQKIPSDLAGWIYLLYDPSNALALRPALERAVAHLLKS